MDEQITLLDVCKIPDVQIHSKTALFKYLIDRESSEMLKLRENIVRLSYTHKIIGVNGDEVGITSKRLPLKFKDKNIESMKLPVNRLLKQDTGFISHRKFYVQPLPIIHKNQDAPNSKQQSQPEALNSIKSIRIISKSWSKAVQIKNREEEAGSSIIQETTYRSTNSLRARSQSTARLNIYKKQWVGRQVSKPKVVVEGRSRNVKSFSNLLSGIKHSQDNQLKIASIVQEENCLFKRLQRLSERQTQRVPSQQEECFVRIQDN